MAKWIFILLATLAAGTIGGCTHGSNLRFNAARPAHPPVASPATIIKQAQDKLLAQQQTRQDAAQSKRNWNNFTKTFRSIVGLK